MFFVVIIGYRSTQLLTHLSDIIKLVNNGLLTRSCMHYSRSKRKCTVSPVDCNILMTHHKTYQKRQRQYQNGFYCDDKKNRDSAMQGAMVIEVST